LPRRPMAVPVFARQLLETMPQALYCRYRSSNIVASDEQRPESFEVARCDEPEPVERNVSG